MFILNILVAGVARCMRSSKTVDSWYFYALHPVEYFEKEKSNPDQTLEILMTQLDPNVMQIFTKEHSTSANQATQVFERRRLSLLRFTLD